MSATPSPQPSKRTPPSAPVSSERAASMGDPERVPQTPPVDHVAEMLACVRASGLKLTPQRMAIVRELAADPTHPTAQELFERLRPALPTMSFATVYNTLDALASAGLSGTLRLGGAARFDPNTDAHHHAVCDRCGAVRDIPADTLAPNSATVRRLQRAAGGFSVRSVERIYRGLCAKCAGSVNGAASR
jgi:Fe2+ or Zn2+ uptake regulation protein